MSLIPKLLMSLSAVFILTTAGAISVAAQIQTQTQTQTQTADSYPYSRIVRPVSISDPKPAEAPKPSTAVPVNNAAKETGERSRDTTNSTAVPSVAVIPPQAPDDDEWQFQVSPYFWLASLHGTGGVGNRSAEVDMSFSDIFGSLDFALMGVLEARKGKLVILTDMEYVAISTDKATPGPLFSSVEAEFKTFIFNPEVGYRVFSNPGKGQSIDVLGGIRVWHVSTELNFGAGILPATQLQGSRTWVDGIAGLRGRAALSPKLFVTGKFDLGGGGSNFTWHLFAGGGYNVNSKVALIMGYRVLDVNYRKDNFIYDMNQRGPIMGVGFKF